jgi:hypothetical protein
LGDRFLRAFLTVAFPDVGFGALEDARIECEVTRPGCRADIVVWSSAVTLIIENKVDSLESEGQCDYLYECFKAEPEARFVLLKPSGGPPASATNDALAEYKAVSYGQVATILGHIMTDARDDTAGRRVAEDYRRTLEREFR